MDGVGQLVCQGFLVREACQCSGAWKWISSLWSAMECPVMGFAMGLCVRCDFEQPVC